MLQSIHRQGYRPAGHPAGLYPQAWQDGKAPPRGSDRL
jgi:hypothetical protein